MGHGRRLIFFYFPHGPWPWEKIIYSFIFHMAYGHGKRLFIPLFSTWPMAMEKDYLFFYFPHGLWPWKKIIYSFIFHMAYGHVRKLLFLFFFRSPPWPFGHGENSLFYFKFISFFVLR
jgi:hypothetical protein